VAGVVWCGGREWEASSGDRGQRKRLKERAAGGEGVGHGGGVRRGRRFYGVWL